MAWQPKPTRAGEIDASGVASSVEEIMLVLSRRIDESLVIELDPGCPPHTTAAELFRHAPIRITVLASGISFTRLGVQAPAGLRIMRAELVQPQTGPTEDADSSAP